MCHTCKTALVSIEDKTVKYGERAAKSYEILQNKASALAGSLTGPSFKHAKDTSGTDASPGTVKARPPAKKNSRKISVVALFISPLYY